MESIRFYCEVYNTKIMLGDDNLIVRYAIVYDHNRQVVNDLVVSKKYKSNEVIVLLAQLPLLSVSSGNYWLVVEARDKQNEVLASQSVFFQRSYRAPVAEEEPEVDFSTFDISGTFAANITNADSLKEFIASLYPISGKSDRHIATNQIAIGDLLSMQQYFYYFWLRQDRLNPETKWQAYKIQVDKVNASFATPIDKGYDTDRGRVYLQYGEPNTIEESEYDPNTYPYEIWHYYAVAGETNRKFVFYSRDRSSNDYVLLHSDVTGEPSAYDWQLRLHEKTTQYGPDLDADQAPKSYGDQSLEKFRVPR
jgi:GWxTD domain-containing protein